MALIDLFNPLLQAIKKALGPFGKLFDLLSKFWTRLTKLWTNINKLVQLILGEITAWRDFREDISVRTKVISIPAAISKTQELLAQVRLAWEAVIDLWNNLKGKFETGGNPTEEAEQAIKDIEASGFRDILSKFPRLLKGAEKVLGFIAIVTDALESILDGLDDIIRIVEAMKAIREEVEHGSTVFLSQSNRRRTVRLEDGSVMKIRVGKLHS